MYGGYTHKHIHARCMDWELYIRVTNLPSLPRLEFLDHENFSAKTRKLEKVTGKYVSIYACMYMCVYVSKAM